MISVVVDFVKANPVLAIGASAILASFWGMLQKLPSRLWGIVRDQVSVTLTVWSEDAVVFEAVNRWLAKHPSTKKMRSFTITQWWNRGEQTNEFALSPGAGLHVIWHSGRPFMVKRDVNLSSGSQTTRQQTIQITSWGRDSSRVEKLLDNICDTINDADTVSVSIWSQGCYSYLGQKPKRSFDSIYMDEMLKCDLTSDLDSFLQDRAWYEERSVPYRRGYLFIGPPGCGKTSVILALAARTGKAIYIINPAVIQNDTELLSAINSAGANIVVAEDIDSSKAARIRTDEETIVAVKASEAGITPSGWLNALDGIGARDGGIFIATTNHPERLDPAFLRAGRIDRKLHFEPAGLKVAQEMTSSFYPDRFLGEWLDRLSYPISQADLQERLLGIRGDKVDQETQTEPQALRLLRGSGERASVYPSR